MPGLRPRGIPPLKPDHTKRPRALFLCLLVGFGTTTFFSDGPWPPWQWSSIMRTGGWRAGMWAETRQLNISEVI